MTTTFKRLKWMRDPDARTYQIPCKGCPDFCDVADTDDLVEEAYGVRDCYGTTAVRQIAIWEVLTRVEDHRGNTVEISAAACELEEAEAKHDAALASFLLGGLQASNTKE